MELLAHITENNGARKEQSLKEHCMNTAQYASQSIGSAKFGNTAYLAGIIHDMGKAKAEYVEYLEDSYNSKEISRGSINHTFAGLIWLFGKYHTDKSSKWESLACEIIGYAAGSHHGMFDCVSLNGENGFLHRLEKDREQICYDEAVHHYFKNVVSQQKVDSYLNEAVREVENFFQEAKDTYKTKGKIFYQVSMLCRLMLSAVIYGDRRDTSEFMQQSYLQKEQETDWEQYQDYFEKKLSDHFVNKKESDGMVSEINQVRNEISGQCLEAASRPPAIYQLNIPTGAGKTLCSFRYALAHAAKYHKKRIIFIIPLLSVLDQNVRVIREYALYKEAVVEHHSNVVRDANEIEAEGLREDVKEHLDRYEFLAESWNSPVIVSTLVQFLNILFSHKTSAINRMQALCDSVIVIDEVQSLPKKMTVMFNETMNFLQQFCGATVILSSATQPCFDQLKWPLRLADYPNLAYLTPNQQKVFRRTEIINNLIEGGMELNDCARFCCQKMEENPSLLLVCNTKTEARALYGLIKAEASRRGWDICHLSTAMCQKHRKLELDKLCQKLSSLQQALRDNNNVKKLVCVSTQLIEAGVDLSFACVVRVLAGIDNLAQSAGRCNRSNEYGETGRVYLINLKEENLSMLKDIRDAQDCTRKVMQYLEPAGQELIGEQAARKFYQYLFDKVEGEVRYPVRIREKTVSKNFSLADLLSNGSNGTDCPENQKFILHQPFLSIGKTFQVFGQDTADVIAPFQEGEDLIAQLWMMQEEKRFDIGEVKEIIKWAQEYTISLYQWQLEKLRQAGLLYSMFEGRVLVLDKKAYDNELGILLMQEREVEDYIL